MAKVKKHKLDYRELSDTTCICGCNRAIKQNVMDRKPSSRLCYYAYLLAKGKTHVFTGSIQNPVTRERKKVYKAIKPMLDEIKRRAKLK